MAKFLILMACILLDSFDALSIREDNPEVSGTVVSENGSPIEFVNVTVFANDSVSGGGTTIADGSFRIITRRGYDKILLSSIGYFDTTIYSKGSHLGRIVMRKSSTTLEELMVKAPLILREADRIVLNISANPLAANKDAQELLQTAPGVWVSDNSLSIYGQAGTTVYIDDNKVNMSGERLIAYLKSIKSSSIASIEIIPVAGAEYNAESKGGIVRIILKRNRIDGLIGSAGFGITTGEYKQWLNPSINLSVHKNKLTVNLAASVNGSPSDHFSSTVETIYPQGRDNLKGFSKHKTKALQGNMMLSTLYDLSHKDRIGLQFDVNADRTITSTNSKTIAISNNVKTDDITTGQYNNKDNYRNINISLNWIHSLGGNGETLKWISNYNHRSSTLEENNRMSWTMKPLDSIYTANNKNRYNVFVSEVSINKIIHKSWAIGAGFKYTFNKVGYGSKHSYLDKDIWRPDIVHDYEGDYYEHIGAPYATLNGNLGKLKLRAGLRAEYFKTHGQKAGYNLLDWFPNATVTYNLREKGDYTISAGYSRNIRRPSFQSLDPVVRQVSDYTYTAGNPDLKPSYTDALNLSAMLARRFTIAVGLSRTKDPIRQMFRADIQHPERIYLTWGNVGSEKRRFIHADGSITLTRWWSLYSSATYSFVSQHSDLMQDRESFGYIQLVASSTFRLPLSFNFTCNCFYNSRMRIGNIYVHPLLNVNPTLQKKFGKDWTVSFGIENMLQRTNKTRTSSSGYERIAYTKRYMAFRLSASYSFNSGKRFRQPRIESNSDKSRYNKE